MAEFSGTVKLTGIITPPNDTDTWPVFEDIYGKGGYRTVLNNTERDAIPSSKRKEGMQVYNSGTSTLYILSGGVTNSDWHVVALAGSTFTGLQNGDNITANTLYVSGSTGDYSVYAPLYSGQNYVATDGLYLNQRGTDSAQIMFDENGNAAQLYHVTADTLANSFFRMNTRLILQGDYYGRRYDQYNGENIWETGNTIALSDRFSPENYSTWSLTDPVSGLSYYSGIKDFTIHWDETERLYHIIGIRSITSGETSEWQELAYSSGTHFLHVKTPNFSANTYSAHTKNGVKYTDQIGIIDSISDINVDGEQFDMAWAPHLVHHDNAYYLFYTAPTFSTTRPGRNWTNTKQKIAVAKTYDINNWDAPEIKFCFNGSASWTTYDAAVDWSYHCRDPFVIWDEDYTRWLMLVSIEVDGAYTVSTNDDMAIGLASATTLMGPWTLYDWIRATEHDAAESSSVFQGPDGLWYLQATIDDDGGPYADELQFYSSATLSDVNGYTVIPHMQKSGAASEVYPHPHIENLWMYLSIYNYDFSPELRADWAITFSGAGPIICYTGHSAMTVTSYTSTTNVQEETDQTSILYGHIGEEEIHQNKYQLKEYFDTLYNSAETTTTLPASAITSGTFDSGNYLFPNNLSGQTLYSNGDLHLNMNGDFNSSKVRFNTGSSIADQNGANIGWTNDTSPSQFEISFPDGYGMNVAGNFLATDGDSGGYDLYLNTNASNTTRIWFGNSDGDYNTHHLLYDTQNNYFDFSHSVNTSGELFTRYNLLVNWENWDDTEFPGRIYWHDGISQWGASLRFLTGTNIFEFSTGVTARNNGYFSGTDFYADGIIYSAGTDIATLWGGGIDLDDVEHQITGTQHNVLQSKQDIWVNTDHYESGIIYFSNGTIAAGEHLSFNTGTSRFNFTNDLYVDGGIEISSSNDLILSTSSQIVWEAGTGYYGWQPTFNRHEFYGSGGIWSDDDVRCAGTTNGAFRFGFSSAALIQLGTQDVQSQYGFSAQTLSAGTIYSGGVDIATLWGGGGVTAHGDLTGLLNNDHPQYRLTADTISASEVTTGVFAGSASAEFPAGVVSNSYLATNYGGTKPTGNVYFHNGSTYNGAYLRFDTGTTEFTLSHNLNLDDDLVIENDLYFGSTSAADKRIYFHGASLPTDHSILWDSSETTFEFSDDVKVLGNITASAGTVMSIGYFGGPAAALRIGDSLFVSDAGGELNLDNSFNVDGSVEATSFIAGSNLIANSDAYINYNGPDGDSFLYFYDNSSPTGAYLKWDDASDRFEFNDTVYASESIIAQNDVYGFGNVISYGDVYVGFTGGSTLNPAVYWRDTGDTLNSFRLYYQSSGDQLLRMNSKNFAGTNNYQLMVWDRENDRVGINTDTPSYDLDVNGTGRFAQALYADGNVFIDGDVYLQGANNSYTQLDNVTGLYNLRYVPHSSIGGWARGMMVQTASTTQAFIGFLGSADKPSAIRIGTSYSGYGISINVNNTSSYSGYVGIGQESGVYPLIVNGDAQATNFRSTAAVVADGVVVGANLRSNQDVYCNYDGLDGNSSVYFYEGSSPTGAYLRWVNASSRFELSDNSYFNGWIQSTSHLITQSAVYTNYIGTQPNSQIYFHDGSNADGAYLRLNTTDDEFTLSHPLNVNGEVSGSSLNVGNGTIQTTGTIIGGSLLTTGSIRAIGGYSGITKEKGITILDPIPNDEATMMWVDRDITVNKINTCTRGTSPNVTWYIRSGGTRDEASPITIDTETTDGGGEYTTISQANINAGCWLWLDITATGGTQVDEFHMTFKYTED